MTRAPAPPQPEPLAPGEALRNALSLIRELRATGAGRFWIALVLLVLGSLTEGLSVLLLLPVLHLLSQSDGGLGRIELGQHHIGALNLPDWSIGLPTLLLIFVGLAVFQMLFNRGKSVYLSDVLLDFTNRQRLSLFRALSKARWDRVSRMSGAELEHALTGEIERIYMCAFYVLSILQAMVGLAIYLAVCLAISWPMTLITLGFGTVALLVMRPFRRRAARFGHRLQSRRMEQFRTVADFLGGLKSARASNREARHLEAFAASLDQTKHDTREFTRSNATGSGLFQLSLTTGAAAFIFLAITWAGLDLTRIVALLLVAMRIAPRFLGLQGQAQQLLVSLPAWRHVRTLSRKLTAAQDDSAGEATHVPPLARSIQLQNVSYSYEDSAGAALDGLSLTIRAGEVTALIGASGSGKSTVADLLMGLIRPQSGTLSVDGTVLDAKALRGWREQTAYVAQESFLIHGSVRANLEGGAHGQVADTEIWHALEMANADAFVRELPEGLETRIGDRGVLLSGGQRQRIALAAAFLREPAFLVLDEATSALDWQAQDCIAHSVKRIARSGTTVVTIAHRPSMVRFADHIYALEDGRVVEDGRGPELMARPDGTFRLMLQHEGYENVVPLKTGESH
ncbi:ABC transporter ATP-binding protein [Thioclava sp. BHET1]|nr:ABC transporter ATP-binding protein [Thioclava sp. BHET1]